MFECYSAQMQSHRKLELLQMKEKSSSSSTELRQYRLNSGKVPQLLSPFAFLSGSDVRHTNESPISISPSVFQCPSGAADDSLLSF